MFISYNPNPTGRHVKDCAVRVVSFALDMSWEEAYDLLCFLGKQMGDMPDADTVWGAALRMNGFKRAVIPNSCPDCYSVEKFAEDHPSGLYVLALGGHVTCVYNGDIYDSWDTSKEMPLYVWY